MPTRHFQNTTNTGPKLDSYCLPFSQCSPPGFLPVFLNDVTDESQNSRIHPLDGSLLHSSSGCSSLVIPISVCINWFSPLSHSLHFHCPTAVQATPTSRQGCCVSILTWSSSILFGLSPLVPFPHTDRVMLLKMQMHSSSFPLMGLH